LKIVREEAREKPVTLQVDLAAERTVLDADPARLQQVFWNVLRNAIKFTPAGGSVSMRTWNSMAGSLFIEVSDTGIGIPGEALDRIFQPFEQAGEESIHRFGGIGLGLAIARAILDLHDGTISARSDGVDRGSTFMIELPRAAARVSADGVRAGGDGASTSDHAARNGRIRLLLVEDHEPTLTVLQRLLLRAGHDVVTASTAESAISAAAGDKKFDGVISDLGLPDGTGYELLGKLRALHPEIEAIALSGYGMEEDLQRSRDAGFMTHLVKPIDFQQLNVALQEVAKKSGAAAARERGTAGVSERTDANP